MLKMLKMTGLSALALVAAGAAPAAAKVDVVAATQDLAWVVRRNTIPDFTAIRNATVYTQGNGFEVEMQKAGPERYPVSTSSSCRMDRRRCT